MSLINVRLSSTECVGVCVSVCARKSCKVLPVNDSLRVYQGSENVRALPDVALGPLLKIKAPFKGRREIKPKVPAQTFIQDFAVSQKSGKSLVLRARLIPPPLVVGAPASAAVKGRFAANRDFYFLRAAPDAGGCAPVRCADAAAACKISWLQPFRDTSCGPPEPTVQ